MEISEWLKMATARLGDAGVETARLDALVLLEDCTSRDRALLLAHPETELDAKQLTELEKTIVRRSRHEPLAYIRHKAEIYGREFYVDERVLVPRPESETMIDLLKELLKDGSVNDTETAQNVLRIADVGCGSGCLGITAALELKASREYQKVRVAFYDIARTALEVAEHNARRYGVESTFHEADLLDDAGGEQFGIILANLPYVPDNYRVNEAAKHEPTAALYGGTDGLDLYRRMFGQLSAAAAKPTYVLTEALPEQHSELADIASAAGFQRENADDFIQLFSPLR